MLIRISHPKFSGVELRGESLMIHSMQGEARVLRENVKDVVVTVHGDQIRIVAFLQGDYAWFLSGAEDLHGERLELGQSYGGGGRLITDGLGNSHLFYFVEQSPGHSVLLRQQSFTEKWSNPQIVSTNVFPADTSYSVTWHDDQYLHLAYLGHKDQNLLYRVYNLEHGVWSGAVNFSNAQCSYPQLISADNLYLFWQEDGDQILLKVREKEQTWSQSKLVSTGEYHAANVGFSSEDGWTVFWVEGSNFYRAPFGNWSKREQISRGDYHYAWEATHGLTLPIYALQEAKKPEESSEPVKVQEVPKPQVEQVKTLSLEEAREREREQKRREEEAKLQAAFVEKAFQTLKEWETLREEIKKWQRELKAPEPVDLTPVLTRVERLERRFLTIKQSEEQAKTRREHNYEQLQEELTRIRIRLRELEDGQKRQATPLWRRVLGRG